jgi:hypothetical protein
MSVVLEILLYRIACHLVSDCAYKVPIFPKLSAPQLTLDLRISPKDLFRTHALQYPHYLTNRVFRRYARKYMHMILGYLYFHNLTIPCCENLLKHLFGRISYLLFQYPLAILRCPDEMVSRVVDCMAHSFDSHAAYYTRVLDYCNPFLPVLPHGASRVGFS